MGRIITSIFLHKVYNILSCENSSRRMNGASRHSGFFYFSLAIPRFIYCAALLLDLDMITLTRFSKFNSNRMLDINTRIFEDFAKMDNLLGGSRAGMLCVLLPCQ